MNANEARKLTEAGIQTVAIDHYVPQVEQLIRDAASRGRCEIINPFSNLKDRDPGRICFLSGEFKDALTAHFRSKGFKVEDRPDPDPGNPCSGPFVSLSW